MSRPRLVLVQPNDALVKVKGILQKHVRSLTNYIASARINNSSNILSTENFVYKVLLPAAALYAGQESLLQLMSDQAVLTSMKDLVQTQGYVSGVSEYIRNHAFNHESLLKNSQDMTVAAVTTGMLAKIASYGFDKSSMKLGSIRDEVFRQIAIEIYERYHELVKDPNFTELAAFKKAFDDSHEIIYQLDLEPEQKKDLLAVISSKLTKQVDFYKEMELRRG
jgi:thymidine phosphorylase